MKSKWPLFFIALPLFCGLGPELPGQCFGGNAESFDPSDPRLMSQKAVFQEGLDCFCAGDHTCAEQKWQQAFMIVSMDSNCLNYSKMDYFFQGMEHFKNKRYYEAEGTLTYAHMLDPGDERTKYFLLLSKVPSVSLRSSSPFSDNATNRIFIDYVGTNTVPACVARWTLTVMATNGEKVRIFAGKGDPPAVIVWNLKEKNKTSDPHRYPVLNVTISLRSIYDRIIESRPVRIEIAPVDR